MTNPITITLPVNKETKGTFRFETLDDNAAVSNVYVKKSAIPAGMKPTAVRITVEVIG